MRIFPPRDRFPYRIDFLLRAAPDVEGHGRIELNERPALIAMNGGPAGMNDTRSQSPDGVPDSAASGASLSSHQCGMIVCIAFLIASKSLDFTPVALGSNATTHPID
jgi:hypothetical protein